MPKAVKGYLANNGTFHEHKVLAELSDARDDITGHCVTHTPRPIDPEKFIQTLEALADPIMEYINAYREARQKGLVGQGDTIDTTTFENTSDDEG